MVDSLRRMRTSVALFLLLALSACGSSPTTQFFALQPVQPSAAPRDVQGPPISVSAVRLPPILDRPELVRRGAGNDVEIRQERRWAAPLDRMSRLVLTRDLAARLPKGMVLAPDAPKGGAARNIVVDVEQFDADSTGRVTLDGDWSVIGARNNQTEQRRHERIEVTAAGDQPAAMSQALGELADRIVAALASAGPPASSRR